MEDCFREVTFQVSRDMVALIHPPFMFSVLPHLFFPLPLVTRVDGWNGAVQLGL